MDVARNIYQRMHAVMKDVGYVQKEEKMVNNQYRFVSHDAVTAKIRAALLTHGIVATTHVLAHTQDGNRTEVDVRVDFVNIDAPEDRVSVNAFGYGIDPQDKGPGKAISYAVKYAYLKAFALETGDDPERDNINHTPKPPGNSFGGPKPITATQEAHDTFEALPEEAQAVVREWAMETIALVNEGKVKEATEFLAEKCETTEDKLAVWSQLPSNVRTKLKAKPAMAEQA